MLDSKYIEKWWFRAFLAIGLFFTWQLFFALSKVQNLDEEKLTLLATIDSLNRKSDNLRIEILKKERAVFQLNNRISEIDNLIKEHISLIPKGRSNDPIIYFITPTNLRAAQKADLTRLSYTLSHVPNLHWIVIEDSNERSKSVREILERSRITYTHLNAITQKNKKMNYENPSWYLPRGVDQRNAALLWIRTQLATAKTGVVYFGDDDNTYDLRIFAEMRKVKRVGVWPVGIVGGMFVETPIVGSNGSIINFNSKWKPERSFPIDMAAFAINITLLLQHPEALFSYHVPRGYQESILLTNLKIERSDVEPLAENCTKVYVWHTRTEKSVLTKVDIAKLEQKRGFSALEAEALGVDIEN